MVSVIAVRGDEVGHGFEHNTVEFGNWSHYGRTDRLKNLPA
jgi:hypothetical protein